MGNVLIPYRGDLVSARQGFRAAKKIKDRRFKRKLLALWNLEGKLYLFNNGSYRNKEVAKLFGLKPKFLGDTRGLAGFGVKLRTTSISYTSAQAKLTHQMQLTNKCLEIFAKYGTTIKVAFGDKDRYDYQIFKNNIESSFDNASDEEIANLLYSRLVMYMVDNDSTDTIDTWNEINPSEVDFFNGDARSNLKYFTYTFSDEDLRKVINDRLFTQRKYRILGMENKPDTYIVGNDAELFDALIELPDIPDQPTTLYGYEAIRNLPADEFVAFIQNNIKTFTQQEKVKKKWYQKGIAGVIFIIIIIVVAVLTNQYWLIPAGIGVGIGTVLVVAGIIISLTGALIGNKVMIIGGQIVSLIGGGINIYEAFMAEQAAIEVYTAQMVEAGVEDVAMQEALTILADDLVLNTALGVGKFAYSAYGVYNNIAESLVKVETEMSYPCTPAEKLNEIYIAEDMSWDFVNQFMPQFVMASTMKIM